MVAAIGRALKPAPRFALTFGLFGLLRPDWLLGISGTIAGPTLVPASLAFALPNFMVAPLARSCTVGEELLAQRIRQDLSKRLCCNEVTLLVCIYRIKVIN
jgi:hypothetical protein